MNLFDFRLSSNNFRTVSHKLQFSTFTLVFGELLPKLISKIAEIYFTAYLLHSHIIYCHANLVVFTSFFVC